MPASGQTAKSRRKSNSGGAEMSMETSQRRTSMHVGQLMSAELGCSSVSHGGSLASSLDLGSARSLELAGISGTLEPAPSERGATTVPASKRSFDAEASGRAHDELVRGVDEASRSRVHEASRGVLEKSNSRARTDSVGEDGTPEGWMTEPTLPRFPLFRGDAVRAYRRLVQQLDEAAAGTRDVHTINVYIACDKLFGCVDHALVERFIELGGYECFFDCQQHWQPFMLWERTHAQQLILDSPDVFHALLTRALTLRERAGLPPPDLDRLRGKSIKLRGLWETGTQPGTQEVSRRVGLRRSGRRLLSLVDSVRAPLGPAYVLLQLLNALLWWVPLLACPPCATPLMSAAKGGHARLVQRLLQLREEGRVVFDLDATDQFGVLAVRCAKEEAITDQILLAQLMSEICDVPNNADVRATFTAEIFSPSPSSFGRTEKTAAPRAKTAAAAAEPPPPPGGVERAKDGDGGASAVDIDVRAELRLAAREVGLTREVFARAIARGRRSPLLAACRLCRVARGTARWADALASATDTITVCFEECGGDKEVLAALLGSLEAECRATFGSGIGVVEALVTCGVQEPLALPAMQVLASEEYLRARSASPLIDTLHEALRDAKNDKYPSPLDLTMLVLCALFTPLITAQLLLCELWPALLTRSLQVVWEPRVLRNPMLLMYLYHAANVGAYCLYVIVALNPGSVLDVVASSETQSRADAVALSAWRERGGHLDSLCLTLLASSFLYEAAQARFKISRGGTRAYVGFENCLDVSGLLCLSIAFVIRICDPSPTFDVPDMRHAPESVWLSVGLFLGCVRTFSFLGEWQTVYEMKAVLAHMLSVGGDVFNFLVIAAALLLATGIAMAVLDSDVECAYEPSFSSFRGGDGGGGGGGDAAGGGRGRGTSELARTCTTESPSVINLVSSSLVWPFVGMDGLTSAADDLDLHVDPRAGTHPPGAGAALYAVYSFLVVVVMLNLLVAMMGATFEAEMERAAVSFKVYKVRRIYELQHAPRVAPPFFFLEALFFLIGALCVRLGLRTTPLEGGWQPRRSFKWQRPGFAPSRRILKELARQQGEARARMDGGWVASVNAARVKVQRMQRRRDGVATREGVYYIVREAVGSAQNDLHEQIGEVRDGVERRLHEVDERVNRAVGGVQTRLEALERKLDEVLLAVRRQPQPPGLPPGSA